MLPAYQNKRVTVYYKHNGYSFFVGLLYLLFELIEHGSREEFAESYFQPVAELLDGDNGNIAAAFVHHAVSGRGRHARKCRKLIYRDVPLRAELPEPRGNSVLNAHSITSEILYKILRNCVYALA